MFTTVRRRVLLRVAQDALSQTLTAQVEDLRADPSVFDAVTSGVKGVGMREG